MSKKIYGRLAALIAIGAGIVVTSSANAQQTGTITLTGTIAQQCSVVVAATASALNLDLSAGSKRVEVGTGQQSCNKKAGYSIRVSSANCASGAAGAKLVGSAAGETLRYSVEFGNPTTGGSQATVTNLLSSACTGTSVITGRDVTNAKVSNEISHVFVNYTGDSALAADTYSDTLTITMVVK